MLVSSIWTMKRCRGKVPVMAQRIAMAMAAVSAIRLLIIVVVGSSSHHLVESTSAYFLQLKY